MRAALATASRSKRAPGNALVGALAVGLLRLLRLFDPDKLADFCRLR